MTRIAQENRGQKARYRCIKSGIDKLEVTVHLTEESSDGNRTSMLAEINGAMHDMSLSNRRKPEGYRDARSFWASKDDTVTVALEKSGFDTRLRFQSTGAVVRGDDSLGHYSRFREVLNHHGIPVFGEQIKQVDFAIDLPPENFQSIDRCRKKGKYGNTRSSPVYRQSDYESIRFGSDARSYVFIYQKEVGNQAQVCRVEFRVARNILDDCTIKTVADLCDKNKRPQFERRIKKLARLTTANPRTASHHTVVKTADIWRHVENHLSALLEEISEERVPASPAKRILTVEDFDRRALSINGSILSLWAAQMDHSENISCSEATRKILAVVQLGKLTMAMLGSDSAGHKQSLWDELLDPTQGLISITPDHYDALSHRRVDIAEMCVEKLWSRVTKHNRVKIERRCDIVIWQAERDLERLNQVVRITSGPQ